MAEGWIDEMKLKVVHAIADIADRSSGVVRMTTALDAALEKAGVDSRICTSIRELKAVVDANTILHVHNSWLSIVMFTAVLKRRMGCRLVVSPHGSMSAWALGKSKWKKRIVWLLGMRRVWRLADAFVAASEKEQEEIAARLKAMGIRRSIEVIRFGCELCSLAVRHNPENRDLHILYLGRVEPVKGLDRLLAQVRDVPNICLRIAGPSIGGYGERLAARIPGCPWIEFVGEVHGEEKEAAFSWADVLVLPSYSENFGSVVAEALSRGVPVIASQGTPWQEVEAVGCGWWTDDFRAAAEAAKRADLVEMGRRGAAWVRQTFNWDKCAEQLKNFYIAVGDGN